jgi:prepilin-type N-terminal cleavage/methylation domain-containing protein
MKNTGFTLIETIVTIVVLALALSGAVFLMSQLIQTNAENKDRIQATYLAQECTELLRNFRDSAWKQNNDWLCAFDATDLTQEYKINTVSVNNWSGTSPDCFGQFAVDISSENTGNFLLYKKSGIFTHDDTGGAVDSKFSRKLWINEVVSGDQEARFTCEVFWGEGSDRKSVRLSHWFANWLKI